jgi:parallel beta-helix repeat protein
MRYISQLSSGFVVQVPEDKNSYINVRNTGATGQGDLEFTGVVSSIENDIVTITNVSDTTGGTLFQYFDLLTAGTDIQVFGYEEDPQPDVIANLTVTGHVAAGSVDFSSSTITNSNLASLTYYVFGYNANTGVIPNYRNTYVVRPNANVASKVLNPDLWNTEQYVELSFSRTSQYVLPVIYRVWGSKIEFLGVIGNNKIGYSGSGSIIFRDLGSTEIPSWEDEPQLPSYMSDIFTLGSGQIALVKKITAKETLEILPVPENSQPTYLKCKNLSLNSLLVPGNTIKFRIDDTKYVRQAINLASTSAVKEVFFPAGVYNIRDSFFSNSVQSDYSNVSLRGVGGGSIIRRLPSTVSNSSTPGLINFTGQFVTPRVSGIRVRSLGFDGNRKESFSLVSPISSEVSLQIRNADDVVVSDCTLVDNGGGGIAIYTSKSINLFNNKILRTGRSYEQTVPPLLIDTSEAVIAQGNLMEFATTGPSVISTEYSTINSNIIRGCGDRGLILETSSQWNAQGNLAYSDNDSIIRSIDTYNNEYSRATIEVRKGFSLDPVYMTVTYGGESVSIFKDSIFANIYQLGANGVKTGNAVGGFRVMQTADQLEAGIFSVTLPGGTDNQTVDGRVIVATGNLSNPTGYMYEVMGDVLIGNFRPLSIRQDVIGGTQYVAIQLRNSSDLLSFQIYSSSNTVQNDKLIISGFSNADLNGWNQTNPYTIVGLDVSTNSILINPIPGFTLSGTVEFLGGNLSILRPNYFIADGNLFVHSF